MKVRVASNNGGALPASMLDERWGLTPRARYPLTIGKEYVVYAISVAKDVFWYYVLDDDERPYPIWYPGPLFEISDDAIPSRWVIGYIPARSGTSRVGTSLISFREWAGDPLFYERLMDGDPVAAAVFQRERMLIDAESSNSRITSDRQHGDPEAS
ncbi:hypothetical protein GCM10027612_86820 [Microbispora bryophytorum subsp. camponoti]